jgi:hypothetical protein
VSGGGAVLNVKRDEGRLPKADVARLRAQGENISSIFPSAFFLEISFPAGTAP